MAYSKINDLTAREEQILKLVNLGMLNREIGIMLSISIDTVKKHVKNIYKKLKVRNRAEAIIQTAVHNSFPIISGTMKK